MSAAGRSARMPALYINHGGGPMPLMGRQPGIAAFLGGYAATLPRRPRAVLVVTAHWECDAATVSTAPSPGLLFDYGGFPPETYRYKYAAPGAPDVAARAAELLRAAGEPVATDAQRGWDHGVFVPMMLMFPDADVPIVAVSLRGDQDPARHLAAGAALAPLRDDGVLIVGSGASFHNFAYFFAQDPAQKEAGKRHSAAFDTWLRQTITDPAAPGERRTAALRDWRRAPSADAAHPPGAAEHLIPLHVVAAAAGCVAGAAVGDSSMMGGIRVSQFEWRDQPAQL